MTDVLALSTIGEIARLLGARTHQIRYIIWKRKIRPHARAGRMWLYSDTAIDQIRQELRDIADRRIETGDASHEHE